MSSSGHHDVPPTLGTLIASALLDSIVKQLPSSQLERGDRKLERARVIADEFESMISQNDRSLIEERITFAQEVKIGIDSKSGISKFQHARAYRHAARDANRFTKHISDRARDKACFSRPPNASSTHASDEISNGIRTAARSLYRCYLSCHNAFPSSFEKEEWLAAAWSEACEWKGVCLRPLPKDEGFVDSGMKLLINMKIKIMHAVESLYRFDTGRAPGSIGHNTRLAHALLTNVTFIYRETNIGGTPHHPYRHPIIQNAVNMTWFQDCDGDGIVFPEYFRPIPIQAIALVLTVIECCIDEWTDGTRKASSWNEGRYKTVYHSHISSLNELRGHPQGEALLTKIQYDLLKDARIHAGVPHEPVTGPRRLPPAVLHGAVQHDLHTYRDNGDQIPTIQE